MSIPANIRPDQIPAAVLEAREMALNAAIAFWQIPSVTGAAANLRVFWSV